MGDNIIQIGEFALKRKRERYIRSQEECRHLHVELDDNGDIVTCLDCNKQVSAYWALRNLTLEWEKAAKKVQLQQEKVREEANAKIHLIAARVVEQAWRRRSLVPTCPHCHAGILPTDGFGQSMMSRSIEIRRREVAKAQPANTPAQAQEE
jgi:hypothetical protein